MQSWGSASDLMPECRSPGGDRDLLEQTLRPPDAHYLQAAELLRVSGEAPI